MNVFVDVNVLLDVIERRFPFVTASTAVWALVETKQIDGMVSAVSYTNVHYLVEKHQNLQSAKRVVSDISRIFDTAQVNRGIVEQAIQSGLDDFEYAVQLFAAMQAKADCILTRDKTGFRRSPLPVYAPEHFMALFTAGFIR